MQDTSNITNEFIYNFLMKMNANMATKDDLLRIEKKLTDRIDGVRTELSERIDGVETNLSNQIEDLARITKEALDKKADLEYA